ncbi:drug resistance transporter, EmrB/QacA subfamily [Nocardioides terrae]|uniref:Drug resistance transporter, EmrB/QacA subfamily n=1 Tax=Nocardioides terrae TaxID=574651 RepID=A0A1I1KWX0_9ACTN|nr:MFS transporter [Nocardioides terrae]SFC65289.1 drug resistance transporter, EmrB/QacA subfamily [Nocardioides terrae]
MSNASVAVPTRGSLLWVVVLASIGAFITSLDVVVVSTALPSLRDHFGASLSDLEWTINGYNLAFACAMLTCAALGDRLGKRTVYVVGLLLFTASSVWCAVSGNAETLIAARVVQGLGAAAVLPLSLSLVSDAFPTEKRGAAIGIWGGITGLGVAAGPVLGGVIIQGLDWQWVFWINVPVGLLTAALCLVKVPDNKGTRAPLDLVGLALAAAGLFALTWAPVRAPSIGWGSTEVVATLTAGVVLLVCFVGWEVRSKAPMLPMSYFRHRGFSTSNGVAFALAFSLIGSLFLVAQMFQIGLGHDPLQAGLRMMVWNAMPMLVAPIAGGLSDRLGNKPFLLAGMLLQGVGLGWLGLVAKADVGYGTLIGPLIVSGVGISMVFPTMANAVVGSVPLEQSGLASGTNNTVREVGGVFGVAVMAAVFAAHGSYRSAGDFMEGFRYAELVAGGVAVIGALIAAAAPGRARVDLEAAPVAVLGS